MRKFTTSQRLQQILSERGLKQVDILKMSEPFQEKLGVKLGKSALSQYVNGIQSPEDDKIYLLAQTLEVSEPWLMGYDVDPVPSTTSEPTIIKGFNIEELASEAMFFDGKPVAEDEKIVIQGIIKAYLENKKD